MSIIILLYVIIDTMQINAKGEGFMNNTNITIWRIRYFDIGKLIYMYVQVEVYKTLNTKLNTYYLVRSK